MPSNYPQQERELEVRLAELSQALAVLSVQNRRQKARANALAAIQEALGLIHQRKAEVQQQQQQQQWVTGTHEPADAEQLAAACSLIQSMTDNNISGGQQRQQQQHVAERLEPKHATIDPPHKPNQHFKGLLQRPVFVEAATMTATQLAHIQRDVALQSAVLLLQLQHASVTEQPPLLQDLQATWDRYLHTNISLLLVDRAEVLVEVQAVWNLQTMQPDPVGAAAYEPVIAGRIWQLQLSDEQEEALAASMQVYYEQTGAIYNKRHQLQQAASAAPTDGSAAESAEVPNSTHSSTSATSGSPSPSGSGCDNPKEGNGVVLGGASSSSSSGAGGNCVTAAVTLRGRQRENADMQQRMDQLEQALVREADFGSACFGFMVGRVTLCQMAQMSAICYPYNFRGAVIGKAIYQQWLRKQQHKQVAQPDAKPPTDAHTGVHAGCE